MSNYQFLLNLYNIINFKFAKKLINNKQLYKMTSSKYIIYGQYCVTIRKSNKKRFR